MRDNAHSPAGSAGTHKVGKILICSNWEVVVNGVPGMAQRHHWHNVLRESARVDLCSQIFSLVVAQGT